MMRQTLLFLFLLLVTACSSKPAVTWKSRILETKQHQLPLAYQEYGEKKNPTLLFLHGFGESKETWRFIVPELSKHYHLVLLDLKGFGASPKPKDGLYSVYDQAKVVAKFMEEKRLENVTVVGRSYGGGVALVLALMQKDKLINPDIRRLVLINSMAYKQLLPSMLRTLNQPVIGYLGIYLISNDWMAKEGYRYAFCNDDLIPKESVELSSAYLSQPLAKYAYLKTVGELIPEDIEEVEKRYKEIVLPALIIWGREDVSISVSVAYKLHRDLKNAELVVLPRVGHMPQEEQPNRVVNEILKFMEKMP